MKYFIYIITSTFLLIGCNKEKETIDENEIPEWSIIKGYKNGEYFERKVEANYLHDESDYLLISLFFLDNNKNPKDWMDIGDIPTSEGLYKIHKPNYSLDYIRVIGYYLTLSNQGEGPDDWYDLDETFDNYIIIDEINKKELKVKGSFQASFIISPDEIENNPNISDTITFTNSSFELKIRE
jgi:hypothetical protein